MQNHQYSFIDLSEGCVNIRNSADP